MTPSRPLANCGLTLADSMFLTTDHDYNVEQAFEHLKDAAVEALCQFDDDELIDLARAHARGERIALVFTG